MTDREMTLQERFNAKADRAFIYAAGVILGALIVMFIEAIPQ